MRNWLIWYKSFVLTNYNVITFEACYWRGLHGWMLRACCIRLILLTVHSNCSCLTILSPGREFRIDKWPKNMFKIIFTQMVVIYKWMQIFARWFQYWWVSQECSVSIHYTWLYITSLDSMHIIIPCNKGCTFFDVWMSQNTFEYDRISFICLW